MNFIKKLYYKKYTKTSYSISNVDLIIDRIFSKINEGIYVDVGCNHPIKYNNTYLLHKKGWRGINIDLDSKSIDLFNRLRKKDVNVKQLVTSIDGEEKNIYFYHDRSAINTISKDLAESREKKSKEIKRVKGLTINSIIENSEFKKSKINLLSIDIENYEFEALKNFNFKKYNIDLIVTEITNINQKKLETFTQSLDYILNSKIYKLLINNNYKLINWVNADLVFFNNNSKNNFPILK